MCLYYTTITGAVLAKSGDSSAQSVTTSLLGTGGGRGYSSSLTLETVACATPLPVAERVVLIGKGYATGVIVCTMLMTSYHYDCPDLADA